MKKEKSSRGFGIYNFKDRNGVACSVQKSSLATEDAIWFGCNESDPKVNDPGKGWVPVNMPEGYTSNTRMHLTRKQVEELLPILQRFADTGEI